MKKLQDKEAPGTSPKVPVASVDQELVQRLLAGDEEAFNALIKQHHAALVRLARMFVSTQA